jgi:hypothetical protein
MQYNQIFTPQIQKYTRKSGLWIRILTGSCLNEFVDPDSESVSRIHIKGQKKEENKENFTVIQLDPDLD